MTDGPRPPLDDAQCAASLALQDAAPAPARRRRRPGPSWHEPPRGVKIASYLLMAAALLVVMWQGMLPGLLTVCLGFLLTRWLTARLAWLPQRGAGSHGGISGAASVAAALVMLSPLLLLALGLSQSRSYIVAAPAQYRELLDFLARTVLELRLKLPPDIAAQLPEGAAEIQRIIAGYLGAKAGALAIAGRVWLAGVLYAYVGLLIGALAAVRAQGRAHGPLAQELTLRVARLGDAFRQIVAAQFWIASFNTLLTALFLLAVLPLWDLPLPYTPALITLTFVAGLVPIVGNLLCNAVITLVGLSVSPAAAVACLAFLVLIHKAEYVINAKVVGQRTHMGVWELLSVMFVAEAVFGAAGLVAAPLFYAYLKKELEAERLV
ncbi:Predicted PurR-regulated permease PerM [Oryzisolibacter propanilivorax]|uniref:Predicted PurR-regulated permease PerM n=1 Tax=Oryzisolibacter propanilivorax TaxID=1527607 RepID=A0A1G9U128_9BURK|nr:AI-2E family transporter [Oryzisolibacter propanilivorax]SDM53235.1 Predicted PurR-regulated permease PerM [Oryzisolibacter propanilivorax]